MRRAHRSLINYCCSALIAVAVLLDMRSPLPPLDAGIWLIPLPSSGQLVGTPILWMASASGLGLADFRRFQFSVGPVGSSLSIVRDFSPDNYFQWTPLDEGTYAVKVIAENVNSGQVLETTASFVVRSRVSGQERVVTASQHPLVFIYSAPPCTVGRMRVKFHPVLGQDWQVTPWKTCQPEKSMNYYIASMRARTDYEMYDEIDAGGSVINGPLLRKRTGIPELDIPALTVWNLPDSRTSRQDDVLLQSINGGDYDLVFPVATDLYGRVLWYYRYREYENPAFPWHAGNYLVQPIPGGTMLLFLNYRGEFDQILREIDLAGNPVRETNVERVNRQLAALGQGSIGYFHHEALRLDNGHTLILGSVEKMLTDVQGVGPVDVLGDMIIDLDENWQVMWTWNAFDHLDVTRTAVLNEQCTVVTVGCPPLSLAVTANDWTHANAIAYSPTDGNLLLSLRNQDWVIKINYHNGVGAGNILWRLGRDGDFALTSTAPSPWFSHQHGIFLDRDELALFDNGNTRCDTMPVNCHSRGQVFRINEATVTVDLELNVDLGAFSTAFGSAQKLSNGNYHFLAGVIMPSLVSRSFEVTPSGATTFGLQTQGMQYRSFRMRDIYTPVDSALLQRDRMKSIIYLPMIIREAVTQD